MTIFVPLSYRISSVWFCLHIPPSRALIVLPVIYLFPSLRRATLYTECLAPIVLLGNYSAFVSVRPLPREGVSGFTIATRQKLKPPLGLKHLG